MNLILGNLGMMLYDYPAGFEWVQNIVDAINTVIWPILIVVAAAGTIYAIVLGVQMARADSTEKREEAKKRVIGVLIGMAIIIGLILLLKLFVDLILPQLIGGNNGEGIVNPDNIGGGSGAQQ
ncbi:MAG: hypothetical protein E7378_02360 [Clostridiales bacterium]|nr:hypothetical protein [Clostridiales bacterium]